MSATCPAMAIVQSQRAFVYLSEWVPQRLSSLRYAEEHWTMTGEEFRRIRENLGTEKLGRVLGYQGTYGIAARPHSAFESGARPIPQTIGRLVEMFSRHGVPDSWAQ
jgi:hypothetical protein